MEFTPKLPHVGDSIFTEINRRVQRYQPVNIAQGFPGFAPDRKLLDELAKIKDKGRHQYAPMPGVKSLRETLSKKIETLYHQVYDPEEEITITAGATQAIFTAISAFIKRGDEVIIFKPAYDCYEPAVELQGGVPVLIEMKAPEYRIDWNEVRDRVTAQTQMIIINTPHNPTGTILTKDDLLSLQEIVKNTSILILSDEVYEHIVFDGLTHQSIARFPELAKRSILVYSFGKTFHVTGWKIGYCLAPSKLMFEFQKVHQFTVFCVNHPAQLALSRHLENPKNYSNLPRFFQQKRDYFLEAIKESNFEFTPAQGTYFQTLSYKNISDEKDIDFVIRLIAEKGLATIPVSAFTKNNKDEKMIRICFAKEEETLKKAAEIINSL